ncbi:hypothetical protein HY469_01140 [Candidatus Roizmanbacteria bacterium]|nr:hypothetical protein [Candidatus Roizmanbacteria bacterium]
MSTRKIRMIAVAFLALVLLLTVFASPVQAQSAEPVLVHSAEASEVNGCRDVPENWNLRIIVIDLTMPIDNNWIPAIGILSINDGTPQEWCTQRIDMEYKAAFVHVPPNTEGDVYNIKATDPYPRRTCRATNFEMPGDAEEVQYELRIYCMPIRTYITYVLSIRR